MSKPGDKKGHICKVCDPLNVLVIKGTFICDTCKTKITNK